LIYTESIKIPTTSRFSIRTNVFPYILKKSSLLYFWEYFQVLGLDRCLTIWSFTLFEVHSRITSCKSHILTPKKSQIVFFLKMSSFCPIIGLLSKFLA
ncbi:hypothetical protein WDU94_012992, partial [Cyamophila willieti]